MRQAALAVLTALVAVEASALDVAVHASARYYQSASGTPMFLIGYYGWASVATGYYIDHPSLYSEMITRGAAYKLNYVRLSLGSNRFTGSTDPPSHDRRPTPTAFLYVNERADLDQWDSPFWDGLRSHCDLARRNGMVVHVAFFDGVGIRGGTEAYRWSNSFWSASNQVRSFFGNLDLNGNGNADEDGEFYRLGDFNGDTGVGHYQRRLIDKTIAETAAFDNVIFEIGNELLGSSPGWNEAVTGYVHARTSKPVTQVGGGRAPSVDGWSQHSADTPDDVRANVAAIVGGGCPAWEDPDGPQLSEGSADDLRRAAFYSFVGGGAAWGGFTTDFWTGGSGFDPAKASGYRSVMLFIEGSGARFWEMTPRPALIQNNSRNSCLAKPGSEYVAYVLNDPSANLDLNGLRVNALFRLFDARAAAWSAPEPIVGGAVRAFLRPSGADDWLIHVYPAPTPPSDAGSTDGDAGEPWVDGGGPAPTDAGEPTDSGRSQQPLEAHCECRSTGSWSALVVTVAFGLSRVRVARRRCRSADCSG